MLRMLAINLDCPDPMALAAFYQAATGWGLADRSGPEFAGLISDDGMFVGFQRAPGHRPPRWPDPDASQQLHMDFAVDDLDAAEELLLSLGATKPATQPIPAGRVFLDPAGHPFCIALK